MRLNAVPSIQYFGLFAHRMICYVVNKFNVQLKRNLYLMETLYNECFF